MASVYRPSYFVTDPATGKRTKKKSPTWHIRYYLPSGERRRVKGYRDKRATEALAGELERKAARQAEGIFDACDDHAKRPLAVHMEEYRAYLAAKGNTVEYVALTMARLQACLDGCRFVKIGDLQPSAVVGLQAICERWESRSRRRTTT